MKKISGFALVAALGLLANVNAVADTTYSTVGSWNGSSPISPFGSPNTATYGQTFVAPTDNDLESFTFYLDGQVGTTLQLQAQVYAWSGSLLGGNGPQGAVGPALFTSAPIDFSGTGSFEAITANTGGTPLVAGDDYIALFTISGPNGADYSNSNGNVSWGIILFSHVANDGGGGFNFDNNGSNYSSINNGSWDDFADDGDSAWTANFTSSSVPEPSSIVLLITTLFGAGIGLRRKFLV